MREFRLGKFLKGFIFIFSPALIALCVWALFQYNDKNPLVYFIAIFPVCIAMIALSVYGIADAIIGRFIIAGDRVILRSPVGYRMLMLEEIRGYRQDENHIRILPIDTVKKEIKVSKYVKDQREILDWLVVNYKNLDIVEGDEEEFQVLQNDEFGITEERRVQKLKEARWVARIVNAGAWILLIWMIAFSRYYYAYGIAICCIYPLIVIVVGLLYRGLISPDEYRDSKMPSTAVAFLLPGISLALRALMDFTILEYPTFLWLAIALISIVFAAAYVLPGFKSASKPGRFYGTAMLLVFLNIFYAYGLVVEANCLLDRSEAAIYTTTVVEKRTSSGQTTEYYLDLKPWGLLTKEQEVKVTYTEYQSVAVGSSVTVEQYRGYLKIPWIEVVL
jgi:hypothetical protein